MTLQVPGKRLTDKFKARNTSSAYSAYGEARRLPPRKKAVDDAPPTPSSPVHTIGGRSLSPSAASPPRKLVSDFKAFGASPTGSNTPLSVFGAPLLPTGPGGGMFGSAGKTPLINGGMRGGEADDDDDDEDGGLALRKDAISLDQVSTLLKVMHERGVTEPWSRRGVLRLNRSSEPDDWDKAHVYKVTVSTINESMTMKTTGSWHSENGAFSIFLGLFGSERGCFVYMMSNDMQGSLVRAEERRAAPQLPRDWLLPLCCL